ncbi:hypothetical protein ALPS_200 [Bacillus phage ALPS]|nr:hypothetical protein ALPS_200 [Bacillus phage ALPS]
MVMREMVKCMLLCLVGFPLAFCLLVILKFLQYI